MKAQEKSLLYNLFKTASSFINGYTSPSFEKEVSFEDDNSDKGNITTNKIQTAEINNKINQPDTNENPESPSISIPENVPVKDSKGISIQDLNSKILRCTKCPLARTRNNVVPGMGSEHPDVLVIGEGPGHDEDMQGLPFVGKAGVLLDKMLGAINLDRKTNCYIANVVKCRPPENRDPSFEEQNACWSFLEAQIHILKPKMILCMGRISGHKLLNTEAPLNQLRGQIHEYNGIPLMVTYHPSALLRNENLKRPAWEDLKLFRKELDKIKQS